MIEVELKFQIQKKIKINDKWILIIWKKILNDENLLDGTITIIITEDEELRKLKLKFFNQDVFTDVITFNLENENDPIEGEVYISLDRVIENAKEFNEKYLDELKRVIIHGCLHLVGYDDDTIEKKDKMTSLENKYLNYMKNL